MNFKQLETFYWIAHLGSFRAAAMRLNATQSTISMRIAHLEEALGVKLFDRSRRKVRVTQTGRTLIEYAENAMNLASNIHLLIGDQSAIAGTVNLGIAELIALSWLPDLVGKLNRIYPRLTMNLEIGLTANLRRKVEDGDVDIALIPGPVTAPNLADAYLGTVEYKWMVSPKLGLPTTRLTPLDLQKWPIVTLPIQSNLHSEIEDWFRTNRAQVSRVDICNSLNVVAAMTVAGLGISLLPTDYYRDSIEAGKIQILNTTPPVNAIEYYALYTKRSQATLVETIARMARETSTFPMIAVDARPES
jgi:DNA-binding transcriptional LysR family regulator